MNDHTYKVVELVNSSTEGTDQAIRNAIDRANQTIRDLKWFEVTQMRGHIEGGKVGHFQVVIKAGFSLEGT